jgi:hypothetical protein
MTLEQILQALERADTLAQQGDQQAAQDARQLAALARSFQQPQGGVTADPQAVGELSRNVEDVGRGFLGGALTGAGALIDFPSQAGRLMGRGIERLTGIDVGPIPPMPSFVESVSEVAPSVGRAAAYEPQTIAGGYAQTAGEFLPGAAVTPGGLLARLGYGVAAPALTSETAGLVAQELGAGETGESVARLAGAIVGPAAAERGIRGLISPMAGAMDDTAMRASETLRAQGVPVTAGQQTGSQRLRSIEGTLAPTDEQLEAFSQAALRTIGAEGTRASDDVLNAARSQIGGVFDDVTRNLNVDVQPYRARQLREVATEYRSIAADTAVSPLIENIAESVASAQPSARQIMTWRTRLSRLTQSNDAATRQAAVDALEAVDDIISDSLRLAGRDADVSALNTARQQWRDYLAIERAATGAAGRGSGGLITPEALGSAVIQQSRTQYATGGRGELGALARSGDRLLRQAPSVSAGGVRTEAALPRIAGAAGGSFLGGPLGAALGTLTPEFLGMAVRSTPMQAYLRNQLVGPAVSRLTPAQRALVYGPATGFPSVFNQGQMQ